MIKFILFFGQKLYKHLVKVSFCWPYASAQDGIKKELIQLNNQTKYMKQRDFAHHGQVNINSCPLPL